MLFMNERDKTRLQDMLEESKRALRFVADKDRSTFLEDELTAYAVIRAIEIIGEAATHISPQFRSQYPTIPWRSISATRNRLIHGYADIDLEIVWETVQQSLPELINQLETILSENI